MLYPLLLALIAASARAQTQDDIEVNPARPPGRAMMGNKTSVAARALAVTLNAREFGAMGDTRSFADGTARGATFASSAATFTFGDVGKVIRIAGAGVDGTSFSTTIVEFTQAHTVRIAASVATNVTAARFWYGTDDTTAVQNFFSYASNLGACAYFPHGAYWLFSQRDAIRLANSCVLGDGPTAYGDDYTRSGSTLLLENKNSPVFAPAGGGFVNGLTFFWPAQDGSSVDPITYKPLFETTSIANFTLENVYVVNAYDLLQTDVGAGSSLGRVAFKAVKAYCINICFNLSNGSADILQIDADTAFSPGWFESVAITGAQHLAAYTNTYGEVFHIDIAHGAHGSIDGLFMTGSFVYGYRYGIRLVSGRLNVSSISGVIWDATPIVLSVEGNSIVTSTTFSGGTIFSIQTFGTSTANSKDAPFNFSCSSGAGQVNITGISFAYARGNFISETANCNLQLNIIGNTFFAWGQSTSAGTYSALLLRDSTSVYNVAGNTFVGYAGRGKDNDCVSTGDGVRANITGNVFSKCRYALLTTGNGGSINASGNSSNLTLGPTAWYEIGSGESAYDNGNSWDKSPTTLHFGPASGLVLKSFTVASLPSCGLARRGQMVLVSDANAPGYDAVVRGGGAVIVPVLCNGAVWVSH